MARGSIPTTSAGPINSTLPAPLRAACHWRRRAAHLRHQRVRAPLAVANAPSPVRYTGEERVIAQDLSHEFRSSPPPLGIPRKPGVCATRPPIACAAATGSECAAADTGWNVTASTTWNVVEGTFTASGFGKAAKRLLTADGDVLIADPRKADAATVAFTASSLNRPAKRRGIPAPWAIGFRVA